MAAIGFYHLTRSSVEQALPKLLEKVLERGLKVLLLEADEGRVEHWNKLLWTYDQDAFLPHGGPKDGDAERQPVYLSVEEDAPNDAQVLVVLDGRSPASLDRFERVIDMFDGQDESLVAQARSRWKTYKDAGHELTYWQQNSQGGWKQAA